MLPARFSVSKTKDDNSSPEPILRPAVRLEDSGPKLPLLSLIFLEISMHQMLKTDLLDRFLTDSVKHKKPMECSEALFDTIDTLFSQVNTDGTIRYCNRVCREATCYSLEETEGRMFWEVFFPSGRKGIHPEPF